MIRQVRPGIFWKIRKGSDKKVDCKKLIVVTGIAPPPVDIIIVTEKPLTPLIGK